MRRVEQAIAHIKDALENKDVLEVACGCAEFSFYTSSIARKVCCMDLDDSRLKFDPDDCANLEFRIMDATKMDYEQRSFDTIVIYNAIGHLEDIIDAVLAECRRVLRTGGVVYIISSFSMDKQVIREKLLPKLSMNISFHEDQLFMYVAIPCFY